MRHPETELYPRLLGEAWTSLAEPVQRLHRRSACAERTGMFEVTRGRSLGARLCGAWMRLPAAGAAVPIELAIEATPRGDRWRRRFAGHDLVTLQYEEAEGVLAERWGPVECRFRLAARDGALVYRQLDARLCLGPLRLRLPGPLAPRVTGAARGLDAERVHVDVAIDVPLFGALIAYRGELRVTSVEAAA